ncbi:hypothetical protein FS935_04700 [Metabacillus litoralis]|uniref:Uncharacterized protein n=1 Tax=Metabacillus litoralis TaxID=152268 RepID=A0A5C6W374_9BACI|nr:hypothetical protein [Metabacillus litoralis]TXC92358.1 hypothetical protein FS935_04700 [Metabacillus litoralis]
MLKKQNVIDLEINYVDTLPALSFVEVIINEKIKIAYDMQDGYLLGKEKTDNYIEKLDFYFKRSFNNEIHSNNKKASSIIPLGLN